MKYQKFPAAERGVKNAGWLRSNFVFSFSDYYNPIRSAFGTLVAFNDDYLQVGKGFGIHPHINMEIISVLLKGKMNHIDSMGYKTIIEPGGVQIMSAGSGLKHEEYNIGEEEVNFLQIWIQPKQQNITPRYQQRHFNIHENRNKLHTIISHEEGLEHCWINQNAKLSMGHFDAGQTTTYSFRPVNMCLFVYVISGAISVVGEVVNARDGIGIWDTSSIDIVNESEAEYLIIETPVNQK